MIYEPKNITLKDGQLALFRSPTAQDAADMLTCLWRTSSETDFVLRYPEECGFTMEQEQKLLESVLASEYQVMITCFVNGRAVGNCTLMLQGRIKTRHRGSVAIAVLKEYWGLGIGTAMFREMTAIAKEHGVSMLDLDFIEGNSRARALYEKMGFRIVAVKPDSIRLKDGTRLAEYYMQLYLD